MKPATKPTPTDRKDDDDGLHQDREEDRTAVGADDRAEAVRAENVRVYQDQSKRPMGHVEHVGEREHRVEELGQLWPRARHPQEGVAVHAYQGHAEQERWPVRQVGIFDEAVDEHDAGVGHEDGYRDQAEEAYVCQEPHVDAAQPVGEIQPLHELMQDRPHVGQPYLTRYPQVDQARVALEVVVRVALGVVVQVAQHQEGEGRGPQTGHVQQDQERKEARR
eukprot:CAMPEP_0204520286 /NCGR_PEP_ID=MMETSP0661-20131031/5184_1 /ASSEMBLY_ACC=CAM_ASM_000606 /TAXON_ID=109239 /ORGANISM="Alexandrium margalefi, Strain AMGDE01CS-322" /LENGTH=220 /DNA_ID=CAMNT_0051525835 /DNA_START=198 /DNA_END=857 /DNA_ORIENTATION=+